MRYVNKEKTAAQCVVCQSIVQTMKTPLKNGDTRVEMLCPVCSTPDMDIIKKVEEKSVVDKIKDTVSPKKKTTPKGKK
jgi:hypothetical protein